MNFLPISQNNSLPRRDTPNESNIMFFTPTGSTCFSCPYGLRVGKTESPVVSNSRILKKLIKGGS
jgi:hypothetical protein